MADHTHDDSSADFTEEQLLRLWGKSDENDETNWHPLLFHLLDVGNVCLQLWDDALPKSVKTRIAEALGLGEADARRVVILLAAQHDLGKASSFQKKVEPFWNAITETLGVDLSKYCDFPGHGFVTARVLPDLIAKGSGGWNASADTAKMLARISGGHHGKFPTAADLLETQIKPDALGDASWDRLRAQLLLKAEQYLFPESPAPSIRVGASPLRDAAIVPLVGGLISVADWIGSSQDHFPPAAKQWNSVAAYAIESRERTARALETFHWTPTATFSGPAKFGDIFRDKNNNPFTPNPMQAQVVTCANSATAPYMLIVEAAMGEGKTEAALYAIDRALTTRQAHGFYTALPTQATGNAMFDRVYSFLEGRKHGGSDNRLNLQLAHGGSFLSEAFDKLRFAAMYGDDNRSESQDAEAGRIVAETWFTYRKRPLLAPFGVGTIDQSLVGVLQTKHWFVRLFGLAGKVILFDEVHAYDIYMSQLLGRLIGWLRLLGCTIVLLSATLPATKRRELIAAWDASAPEPAAVDYPRVTMVGGGDKPRAWTVGQTNLPKTVDVAYTGLEFAKLAETLEADLPDGGCAALICNTVGRAQEARDTLLTALGPKGWRVELFHARTIAKWRQKTEKDVLRWFGKQGKGVQRPRKTILIGTQVMEQSLDLDFDWMASEIAPIDLLLQRMGRLWRHTKRTNRKLKDGSPKRFYVLCGDKSANEPPDLPPYTDWVYEAYVLLRTRLAFPKGQVTLPYCIESLIKAVYDDPDPTDLPARWTKALADSRLKMDSQREKDEETARVVMVAESTETVRTVLSPGAGTAGENHPVYDDEDPRVHPDVRASTRLGDPSISIICLGTDLDGKALASVTAAESEPTLRGARALLGYGMSLSNRGLFFVLKEQSSPTAWEKSPYLRFHRALTFADGIATVGGYKITLSRAKGSHIEKEVSAEGD